MNNRNSILNFFRRLGGWLARPLVEELPLIVMGAAALTPHTYLNTFWCLQLGKDWTVEVLPGAWHATAVAVLVSYVLAALVTWLPGRRWTRIVAYLLVLAAGALSRFLVYNFKSLLTPAMLSAAIETTGSETSDFLHTFATASGTVMMAKTMFVYVLLAAAALWLGPRLARWLNRRWVKVLLLACALPFVVHGTAKLWRAVRPVESINAFDDADNIAQDFVSTTICSVRCVEMMRGEMAVALEHALDVGSDPVALDEAFDSTTVVLVLGESYNRHHAALYGYPLPTTPTLNAERDRGSLTVFTDAISPYNTTSITLKNLFSCSSIGHGEQWWTKPMFTAVFSKAGYPIHFWDIQRDFKMAGNVSAYAMTAYLFDPRVSQALYASTNDQTFEFDEQLLDDYFAHPSAGERGRKLVILHIWGQHIWYRMRYPDEYARFTGADIAFRRDAWLDDDKRQVIADYDNATLYNDAVMARVFEHYAGTEAVVVMLADHGEEVYDYRDMLARDHQAWNEAEAVRNENEIPLVVWCSPLYRQRHPQMADRLQQAARKPVMNDDLCQLLFPLAGISSRYAINSRNPLSHAYKPGKRLIYDRVDYDSLMLHSTKQTPTPQKP